MPAWLQSITAFYVVYSPHANFARFLNPNIHNLNFGLMLFLHGSLQLHCSCIQRDVRTKQTKSETFKLSKASPGDLFSPQACQTVNTFRIFLFYTILQTIL